jgi:hypothetical protein
MMKIKMITIVSGMFLACKILDINAVDISAQKVFGSWIHSQKCYADRSFNDMPDRLNEFFLQRFNKHYLKHKDELAQFVPFLSSCTDGYISVNGDITGVDVNIQTAFAASDEFRQNFSNIYHLIEGDMPKFILYLKDHGFIVSDFIAPDRAKPFIVDNNVATNNFQNTAAVKSVIDKYNTFGRLLFSNPDKNFEKEHLFAFANRCFEYCFKSETGPDFNAYLNDPSSSQLVKFMYSIIWYNLVGQGWKDWNSQTLAKIAKKTKGGKRVVYIAGGMDIYQLLKHEIYNIDIIDPFLESQDKYYASNYWKWFIKGSGKKNGLKDKIVFDFDGQKINLIRKKYGKNETGWVVCDQDNKYLGNVSLHRRFCEQGDFATCGVATRGVATRGAVTCDNKFNKNKRKTRSADRLILMSFNELYYVFLPKKLGGWGMDIDHLPKDFKIYAKQLRAPVTVDVLKNIRKAEEANFKFIRLGSDPA